MKLNGTDAFEHGVAEKQYHRVRRPGGGVDATQAGVPGRGGAEDDAVNCGARSGDELSAGVVEGEGDLVGRLGAIPTYATTEMPAVESVACLLSRAALKHTIRR